MPRQANASRRVVPEFTIEAQFQGVAQKIVAKMRDHLLRHMPEAQAIELRRLSRTDLGRIAGILTENFATRCVGLHDLARRAHRELCVIAIKRSVPSFRAELASGLAPEEYFQRFYRGLFQSCDIPSHEISIVDPNLHAFLKRSRALPKVTRSLQQGRPPSSASRRTP